MINLKKFYSNRYKPKHRRETHTAITYKFNMDGFGGWEEPFYYPCDCDLQQDHDE